MQFTLSRDDPLNTVLTTPDGRPWYQINTPNKFFGSADTKIMNVSSGKPADIGTIEWHSWHDCVVMVGRRRVPIHQSGKFSMSQSFQASDGRQYKWKVDGMEPLLVTDDHSHTPVAIFKEAKDGLFTTKRPASLQITSMGMQILDEIITTFVWFEEAKRQVADAVTG